MAHKRKEKWTSDPWLRQRLLELVLNLLQYFARFNWSRKHSRQYCKSWIGVTNPSGYFVIANRSGKRIQPPVLQDLWRSHKPIMMSYQIYQKPKTQLPGFQDLYCSQKYITVFCQTNWSHKHNRKLCKSCAGVTDTSQYFARSNWCPNPIASFTWPAQESQIQLKSQTHHDGL